MNVQEAPPQAPAGPRLECPQCHAPVAPGQDFCLECGNRLGSGFRRAPSWRLPLIGAVLLVLVLGAGAGFAVGALVDDEEVEKKDVARAQPAPATPPPPPAQTTPAPTTPPAQTTPGQPPPASTTPEPGANEPTPAPSGGDDIAEWPQGKTAYTVVLQSSDERRPAEEKAREAIRAGVPAGLLFSSDYASLNPGYWVVFAGQYKDFEQAQRAGRRFADQGFGGGYPRLIRK
jgi:hypothetical protein